MMSLHAKSHQAPIESVSAYLTLALTLSHTAGRELYRTYQIHPNDRPSFITKTTSADVVTETDSECERIVKDGIRNMYPRHVFLGEESYAAEEEVKGSKSAAASSSASSSSSSPSSPSSTSSLPPLSSTLYPIPTSSSTITWICDPIDGTNNFVHALPSVAVSIGVLQGKEVVCGVVHCPVARETYFAKKGEGAWMIPDVCNETGAYDLSRAKRMRVSQITTLEKACVATEMGYQRAAPHLELMQAKTSSLLLKGLQSLRMSGSCCVNMINVALGKVDCYFEGLNTLSGPKPWDTAAASLIVTEAGGICQDITGEKFSLWNGRVLVAANEKIAREVTQGINTATKEWCEKYQDLAKSVVYVPDEDEKARIKAKL